MQIVGDDPVEMSKDNDNVYKSSGKAELDPTNNGTNFVSFLIQSFVFVALRDLRKIVNIK